MKNIQKKIVFSTLLILLSSAGFCQGVVFNLELNSLYHGYDNLIQIGYQEGLVDVSLQAEGATLTKTSKGYIVRTLKGSKLTEITGTLKNGDTVCHYYYRNMPLPQPVLYWGYSRNGEMASPEEKLLLLHYSPGIVFENEFNIIDWRVTIGERVFNGKGNLINDEVKKLIYVQNVNKVKAIVEVNYTSKVNPTAEKTSGIFWFENPYYQNRVSDAKVYFIDKDSSNTEIFDPESPNSLIGLVQHNTFQNQWYLSKIQSNRLLNSGANLFKSPSAFQTIPFVEDNPKSPNYGMPKIEVLPDGTMMYNYPEPANLYYDVLDINRIVVFESTFIDSMSGQKTTTISHVGLAKKYSGSGKYDVVCVIPFNEISSSLDIETIQETTDSLILNQYKRIPSNLDWDQVLQFGSKLEYLPNMFTQYGHVTLPFFSSSSKFDEYAHVFDTVDFVLEERSTIPLANVYGEDSTRLQSNGNVEIVYPEREKIFKSISAPVDSIHVYVISEIENVFFTDRTQPSFKPQRVVYTVNTKDGEFAFCQISYLNRQEYSYSSLFDRYIVPLSQLEWKKQIQQSVSKGRAYDLTNKKDIKALDRQFNLDAFQGLPANLLGVCVGCK